MPITTLPVPPTRADPENFAMRADTFLGALPGFAVEANAMAVLVNSDANTALTQAGIATAAAATAAAAATTASTPAVSTVAANLSGTNTIGTVAGSISNVNAVGADIAAIVAVYGNQANINAAVADLPSLAAKASLTGATFSGHINVPAGATGNRAPRASEVGRLAAANTFTALQTSSSSGTVGIANTTPNYQVEVVNMSTGAASVRFHRNGLFAAFLGIDGVDNALVWGGGSMGSVRRHIYHQGNILGTVSQAGGVPTGAVVETATNGNGTYTRWADGTQICTAAVANATTSTLLATPVYHAPIASGTWAAAFVAAPRVSVQATDAINGPCWAGSISVSTTGFSNLYRFSVLSTAQCSAVVVAHGRWF